MKRKLVRILLLVSAILVIAKFSPNIIYYYPDGVGYWVYLPTIFLDNDLDFSNNLEKFSQTMPLAITKTGLVANLWNVGTAVFLSPFFLIAKYFGFSSYLLLTNFGSTLYGILACVLIYISLRHLGVKIVNAGISSVITFFATPLFFYAYFLPQSAHSVSAFIVSFFLTYWLVTLAKYKKISRWIFLGLIAGLMAAVRSQEVLFAFVVIPEIFFRWMKEKNFFLHLKLLFIFLVFTIFGFSAQLLIWKFVYGSFLFQPQAFNLSIENFALFDVLFSPFHGILFWTPIIFLAIFSSVLYIKKDTLIGLSILLPIFFQILLISLLTAWWGGYSFGIRYFSNLVWPIGVGIGLLLNYVEKKQKIIKIFTKIFLFLITLWTFFLALGAKMGKIDIYSALNFEKLKNDLITFLNSMLRVDPKNFFCEVNFPFSQEFLILVAFMSVFLLWQVHKLLAKSKFTLINLLIIFFLLFWNYKIFTAYRNTDLPLQLKKETLPLSELQTIFLAYDLDYRVDYFSLTKNEEGKIKTLRRLAKLNPKTEYAKNLISFIQKKQR